MANGFSRCLTTAIVAAALALLFPTVAGAQGKTDVVTLANGDRITGEIARLERGRLEFKTDDIGDLYLEWDKLVSLVSPLRLVEVELADGRRFLGTLAPSTPRELLINDATGPIAVPMSDVTFMTAIGRSFWSKLDGTIDAGFTYTKSSGIAQLNANTDTVFRRPQSQMRLTTSLTTTQSEDSGKDDRAAVEGSYLRYPWPRWFVTGTGRFETNESLGLVLRSQVGGAIGPRIVNSNRATLSFGAGLAFNDEQGVDVPRTKNLDALVLFHTAFYTYDRPRTNVDVSAQYYPSLSNLGRQRLQLDASAKREFWKDLFLSLSMFDTFDSRPPTPDADKNDVGVVISVGWSY
jgi:hypothetical protein